MFAVRVPPPPSPPLSLARSLCFPKTATHADYLSYIIEIGRRRPYQNSEGEGEEGRREETPKSVRSKPAFFFRWRHFHLAAAVAMALVTPSVISDRLCLSATPRPPPFHSISDCGERGRVASFWRAFPPLIRIVPRPRGALLAGTTELKRRDADRKSDADAICERNTQPAGPRAPHPPPSP